MAVKQDSGSEVTFICKPEHDVKQVFLAGDFNGWDPENRRMVKIKDGSYRARMKLAPGEHEYKFIIDGQWVPDSQAEEVRPSPIGGQNSVIRI